MANNNKKKNFFGLCRVAASVLVFLLILQGVSLVFVPKGGNNDSAWTTYTTKAYIGENQNSVDVLFIGNSNLYRGFSPIDCWNATGIASCDSGKPLQTPRGAYGILRSALRYQNPKIVVLETDLLFSAHKKIDLKEMLANQRKIVKSGLSGGIEKIDEKLETKLDYYFPKLMKSGYSDKISKTEAGLETSISYYFPLIRFHRRWDSLQVNDFTDIRANYRFAGKGFIASEKVKAYEGEYDYMAANADRSSVMKESTSEYLQKIMELCGKNNITLVLLSVPSANSWSDVKHNAVSEFAAANKLEFIDLNKPEANTGIDWRSDTNDGGTHLNLYGARKVTAVFGQYLKEQYALPDRRNDPAYAQWAEDAKTYLS